MACKLHGETVPVIYLRKEPFQILNEWSSEADLFLGPDLEIHFWAPGHHQMFQKL